MAGIKLHSSKKGIFFTFIAILTVTILVMAFSSQSYLTLKDKVPVTESRVNTADNYIGNLKNAYFERSLRTSSYRALYSLILYENKSKTMFSNMSAFNCAFSNVMLYGMLYDTPGMTDLGKDVCFGTTPNLGSSGACTMTNPESFNSTSFLVQSFVPTASGNLDRVNLMLKWNGGIPVERRRTGAVVELRDSVCGNSIGILLDNWTITFPGNMGWNMMNAQFLKSPYIVSGNTYYFVFKTNSTDLDVSINVAPSSAPYAPGTSYNLSSTGVIATPIDSITGKNIMNGTTFSGRLELMKNKSWEVYNIKTDFANSQSVFNPMIYQSNKTGAWSIGANVTVVYSVDAGIASWNRTDVISTQFSILGLDDPMYLVKTSGLATNKILEANFTTWNSSNLYFHIQNHSYRADPNASSFLMRFYGDYSRSNCCGIESIVYPEVIDLGLPGLGNKDVTYVDCGYFSDGAGCSFGDLNNITGITSDTYRFKLDSYHVLTYNVSDLAFAYG